MKRAGGYVNKEALSMLADLSPHWQDVAEDIACIEKYLGEASQDLLYDLMGRIVQDDNTYTHKWKKGDFVIWDNRSSLHKANYGYNPADPKELRKVYRALIRGERPY